jgi:hypothetical protein
MNFIAVDLHKKLPRPRAQRMCLRVAQPTRPRTGLRWARSTEAEAEGDVREARDTGICTASLDKSPLIDGCLPSRSLRRVPCLFSAQKTPAAHEYTRRETWCEGLTATTRASWATSEGDEGHASASIFVCGVIGTPSAVIVHGVRGIQSSSLVEPFFYNTIYTPSLFFAHVEGLGLCPRLIGHHISCWTG